MRLFSLWVVLAGLALMTSCAGAVELRRMTAEDGARYLLIAGEIEFGDGAAALREAVLEFRPEFITFDSPGGNVVAAMGIGRAIRDLGLPTIQIRSALCVSACSLAYLGGVQRAAEAGSIGVHQSSFSGNELDSHAAVAAVQALTGEVLGYMVEMGANPRLLQFALSTGTDDMRYLTAKEMTDLGVTTPNRLQRIAIAPSASAPTRSGPEMPAKADHPAGPTRSDSSAAPVRAHTFGEQAAVAFTAAYQEAWSGPNGPALAAMASMYADTVEFYGKTLSRNEVMATKREFAERWPLRAYAIRPGTTEVSCAAEVCNVSAIVEWFARSVPRKATSTGTATFTMVWHLGSGQIRAESGQVLSNDRKKPRPDRFLSRWLDANSLCRGGSGDDTETLKACDRREAVGRLLDNVGWCYGRHGEYGYQMEWHACGRDSNRPGD